MTLPVIAITNASTCLSDAEVAAAIPVLQRQVTIDFRAYWEVDCQLTLLPRNEPLVEGWWQISVLDNPDQAGALGYHELSSRGTPLGKVFAGLDLQSGGSWTVTLSHELLEMLADPWINWCAQGSDGKIYALEVCDAVEADGLGYEIDGVLVSDFITPSWFEPTQADRVDFKRRVRNPLAARCGRIHLGAGCGRRLDAGCGAGPAFGSDSIGKQEATAKHAKGGVEEKSAAQVDLLPAPANSILGDFDKQAG